MVCCFFTSEASEKNTQISINRIFLHKPFSSSCQIFLMCSKYCSMKSWCSTWKWPKIEQFQYTASFLFDCLHEFLLHGIRLIYRRSIDFLVGYTYNIYTVGLKWKNSAITTVVTSGCIITSKAMFFEIFLQSVRVRSVWKYSNKT